jgi:hypothetical protein
VNGKTGAEDIGVAQYFFDINDGRNKDFDETGHDLPDDGAAREAAIRELALMMGDEMPDGDPESYVVTVRDAGGVPIFVASANLICEALKRV